MDSTIRTAPITLAVFVVCGCEYKTVGNSEQSVVSSFMRKDCRYSIADHMFFAISSLVEQQR